MDVHINVVLLNSKVIRGAANDRGMIRAVNTAHIPQIHKQEYATALTHPHTCAHTQRSGCQDPKYKETPAQNAALHKHTLSCGFYLIERLPLETSLRVLTAEIDPLNIDGACCCEASESSSPSSSKYLMGLSDGHNRF